MHKILKVLLSFLTVGLIGATSSCMEEEMNAVQTLFCSSSTIATHGEQDVVLKLHEGETPAVVSAFKSTISAKDITFKFSLVGRSVTSIKYLDPSSIALTIGGDSRASLSKEKIGEFYISGKAIENGVPTFSTVIVEPPGLVSSNFTITESPGSKIKTYSQDFQIIGGKFTNPFKQEYVELANKSNGILTIQALEEEDKNFGIIKNIIRVNVEDFDTSLEDKPSVIFKSSSNTLGLELTTMIGIPSN
ncbi:MAG: hypothetical protein RR734_03670 [Bacilli bacterium]